ncbi:unnamed protein product [Paramecium sonneborni]|uniref:Oxidation resistance protein 1 n=1 Tax=Paramecium sonneborni TaxID=65129 RepID=A0A8S1NPY8_9CILI|nr:unnamed protein product [Paramecium sonneborni]
MGNSKSKEITKHAKVAFTPEQLQQLEKLFQCLNGGKDLVERSFLPYFPENPDFSIKLFNWMVERSPNHQVNYTNFVVLLELLLKELKDYYLSDYKFRNLEKFELFALISLECLENDKDSINRFAVCYSQGSIVIRELLNIYSGGQITNSQRNDLAARSVTNTIFDQKDELPFNQFVSMAKAQLIYANKLCKYYFNMKFLGEQSRIEIPRLNTSSFILNDQVLALLQLSSPDFSKIKQLQLQFSSSVSDEDLDHISDIVVNTQKSLLFIFRNREDESQNDTFQQQVFGAYISIDPTLETHYIRRKLKDPMNILYSENDPQSLYFGDEKSFLFSLMPKYQLFMSTFDQRSKQCFAYINNKSFRVDQPLGLAFGGDGKGNHRIWLDDNLKGNATCRINNQCDLTYEMGYLLEPHIEFLNLTCIEIWSVEEKEANSLLHLQSKIETNKEDLQSKDIEQQKENVIEQK